MLDEIDFEILRHRLDSINEDAAAILANQSGSQLAAEARDLNSVIMAPDGAVVCCGRYVLAQVVSMNLVVRDILDRYRDNPGFGPDDQFLTNDPYVGTLHQPDVVVVAPIFVGDVLVGWSGSTTHQPDVGGPNPGGITYDARSIHDEALPIPPIRLVERGVLRADLEREYLSRSRTAELNRLDLLGQIAANKSVVEQVRAICREYGTERVGETFDRLLDRAETMFRERLSRLADGTFRHVAYVEYRPHGLPDGEPEQVYTVRLDMTKTGDQLVLDFTGSDQQAPGTINATYPALANFAVGSVLIYLCGGLLWAPGGIWRAVEIRSRPGTVVHARWPAGVAMSTASTCQAIRVCVNACAARLLETEPDLARHVMASCQGAGGGGGTIHGTLADGRAFATMTLDEITGGGGATSAADGADSSGFTTSPGASCVNVEVNETYLPILYESRAELADTGGPGTRRGGVGSVARWRPHGTDRPIEAMSFGQGLQHPVAAGVAGGEYGAQSVLAILPTAGTEIAVEQPMPVRSFPIAGGQVHLAVSQGGGGVGDPLARDPGEVRDDVVTGHVSVAGALRDYGVVVLDGAVDEQGTEAARAARRRERIGRAPRAPLAARRGRPLAAALDLVDGRVCCARCGADLCAAEENPYDVLVPGERAIPDRSPFGVRYPGCERFVMRHFWCPGCAAQVDVQLARPGDPVVRSFELDLR